MPRSVLVVTCADSKVLRDCLARVRAQAEPLGAELVLVVNTPEDALSRESRAGLAALVDRFAFEPRVGKSRALNCGVSLCSGEVVAFTDDDALPRAGWLRAITDPLLAPDRPAEVVGAGGRVLPVFPMDRPRWYADLVDGKPQHFLGPRQDFGAEPSDYATLERRGLRGAPLGANCAFRREVFERHRYHPDLGPNRETGLRGGEDFLLGLRVMQEGRRLLWRPDACVDHPVLPERIDHDFVRRGYYLQGIESMRMAALLGAPRPEPRQLHRKLRREHRRLALRVLARSKRTTHSRMRLEFLRGCLAELERC